jgi:hypothetical protein
MQSERPAHVLGVPRWTLAIHIAQLALAVIILGLNAFGIHWIAYNWLVYSLVVCLCTLGVAIYMLVSSLYVHKAYNYWAFLALHIWMLLFWLIQFSGVARLAALWSGYSCYYSYYSGYSSCSWYFKRDLGGLHKRDSVTYGSFWGALIAAAVFGAFEFILWGISLIILGMYIHRHQNAGHPSAPPPMYTGASMGQGQAVPVENYNEKYNAQVPGQPHNQGTPQPQYAQPVQQQTYPPQPQPPQPAYNQAQGPQFTTPYTQQQDPVNRVSSISPVTVGGQPQYPSPNTVELATPQHTGNPEAAELNTTPSHPTNAAELGNNQQRQG